MMDVPDDKNLKSSIPKPGMFQRDSHRKMQSYSSSTAGHCFRNGIKCYGKEKNLCRLLLLSLLCFLVLLLCSCSKEDAMAPSNTVTEPASEALSLADKKQYLIDKFDLQTYLEAYEHGTDKNYDKNVLNSGRFIRKSAVITEYKNGESKTRYRVYTGVSFQDNEDDSGPEAVYDSFIDLESPALENFSALPPLVTQYNIGENIQTEYYRNIERSLRKTILSVSGAELGLLGADSELAESVRNLYTRYGQDYLTAALCYYRQYNPYYSQMYAYFDSYRYESVIDFVPGFFVREESVKGEKTNKIYSFPVASEKHVYQYDEEGRIVTIENYTAKLPEELRVTNEPYVYECPEKYMEEYDEQKSSVGASDREEYLREFLAARPEYDWEAVSTDSFYYSNDGNLQKETRSDTQGRVIKETLYYYDEDGLLIREERSEDGEGSELNYEYSFDDYGNLICVKCSNGLGLPVYEEKYLYTLEADASAREKFKENGWLLEW